MSSAHIVTRLQSELQAGMIVEAALPIMMELEEVSAIMYLPGDWVDVRLKGLPEIAHIVHMDNIRGFRVRRDD